MYFKKSSRILASAMAVILLCSASVGVHAADRTRLAAEPVSAAEDELLIKSSKGGTISVTSLQKAAKSYPKISTDFLRQIKGKKTITQAQFKKYASAYSLPQSYVQLFIRDAFAFKSGNTYQYIPINSRLAKNNYNWNHLVYKNDGEIQYRSSTQNGIKGIDVSSYQNNINWKKVKADGVQFAMIRLGYRGYGSGGVFLDEKFHQNIQGATAVGIKVGVYFYSQAVTTREAKEEAAFVVEQLEGYDLDYPVAFDVENAGSAVARTNGMSMDETTDVTIAFCDYIEQSGYHPMVYTNSNWFVTQLDMTRLAHYDKWMAQYYSVPFFPYQFQIWQYSGTGRVNGISGNVDMNISFERY